MKQNSLQAWILAARPKTLSGAAVPVMIGIALAYVHVEGLSIHVDGVGMNWAAAILCLLFAFVMQIDANFVNDYFDCLKGNDDSATRLGPKRACSEGWITMPAMKRGIIVTTIIGALCGLPLIAFGGWGMIIVGALCILFCFLYTTKLSYMGLGDVLVLVFFGIVPVCLTYYVCIPEQVSDMVFRHTLWDIPAKVFWVSVACGLIIDTLLIVNNYRDRDNDRRDGKITLVVRIGEKASEALYSLLGYIGVLITWWCVVEPSSKVSQTFGAVLVIGYAVLNMLARRKMVAIKRGKELNKILGMTARNILLYGILTVLTILSTLF